MTPIYVAATGPANSNRQILDYVGTSATGKKHKVTGRRSAALLRERRLKRIRYGYGTNVSFVGTIACPLVLFSLRFDIHTTAAADVSA